MTQLSVDLATAIRSARESASEHKAAAALAAGGVAAGGAFAAHAPLNGGGGGATASASAAVAGGVGGLSTSEGAAHFASKGMAGHAALLGEVAGPAPGMPGGGQSRVSFI